MANYPGFNLPKRQLYVQDAGLGRRLLAAAIDIILLEVILLAPFSPLFESYSQKGFIQTMTSFEAGVPEDITFVFLFAGIAAFVYVMLFTYYFRQSFGMMVLRIHVEGDLTAGKSFLRGLVALPFFPFYLFWITEPVLVLWKRQGLLDLMTSTRTVILRAM